MPNAVTPLKTLYRRRLAWLLAVAMTACIGASEDVAAQIGDAVMVDLPRQPLTQRLIYIGMAYGAVISFDPTVPMGREAGPLRGYLTIEAALRAALAGTGLRAVALDDGGSTWTVLADGAASDDPGITTTTLLMPRPVVMLDPVLIEGRRFASAAPEQGLGATRVRSATRTESSIAELPLTVSVVTRDSLMLQGEPPLDRALGRVAGVHAPSNEQEFSIYIDEPLHIRGLPAQLMVSGIRTLRAPGSLDGQLLERIEVAKGPLAAALGKAEETGLGGIVNAQLKRPGESAEDVVRSTVDSVDGGTSSVGFDLSSEGGGAWQWRLVGSSRESGRTDGGYAPVRSGAVLGGVRFKANRLDVTASILSDRIRRSPPASTIAYSPETDEEVEAPLRRLRDGRSRPLTPTDSQVSAGTLTDIDAKWSLSPHWHVRAGLRTESRSTLGRQSVLLNDFGIPEAQQIAWNGRRERSIQNSAQLSLHGVLNTGPIRHRVMLGADRDRWSVRSINDVIFTFADDVDPVTGQPIPPNLDLSFDTSQVSIDNSFHHRGVVLQDQARWGAWALHLAVRRASYDSDIGVDGSRTEAAISPSGDIWDAGLAYDFTPTMTLYAGSQRNVSASYFNYVGQGSLRQQQLGAKFALFDNRGLLTVEAFRIEDSNQVAFSLLEAEAVLLPRRRASGLEIEYAGRLGPRLDAAIGIEWVQARDSRFYADLEVPEGKVYQVAANGVPSRALRFVAQYRLPTHLLAGTSMGFAAEAVAPRWVTAVDLIDQPALAEPFRLPGHVRFDLTLTRDMDFGSIDVGVRNLGNSRAYGNFASSNFVPLLPKRSLFAGFRWAI